MIPNDKLAMLLSLNEKLAMPLKLSNSMAKMSAKVQLLTKHNTTANTLMDLLPNSKVIEPKVSMLLNMHTTANKLHSFSPNTTYLQAHSKVKSILDICFNPTVGELMQTKNKHYSAARIAFERLSDLSDIGNTLRTKLNPIIPDDAIVTLQSIILKQRTYLKPYFEIRPTLQSVYWNELNSLQFALKDISSQIISSAALESDWDALKQFEDLATEVSDFTNDSSVVTKADLENLIVLVTSLINKVDTIGDEIDKLSNSFKAKLFNWIQIISFLLLIKDQALLYLNSDNSITKQEFLEYRTDVHQALASNAVKRKTYRAIQTKCKVRVKPQAKSYILASLPKGFPVLVLDTNHKWAYISFLNPEDNINQTGWIHKKCLGAVVEY